MPSKQPLLRPYSLDVRGTLSECPLNMPEVFLKYVYQGTAPGKGNIPHNGAFDRQRRRWMIPSDPKTDPQMICRAKFHDGVVAWQAMTPEQKHSWRARGKQARLPAYQAFLSDWLKTH